MRAALLDLWPALSECFNIHPWHTPLLSEAEMSQYIDDLPAALQRRQLTLKMG